MITITLNGKIKQIPENLTIRQALQQWQYNADIVAVAINMDFVPRAQHSEQCFQANDKVDIVAPMQGG